MATNDGKSNERVFSHGSCAFERTSPSREDLSPETPKLNVIISFDEALKLIFGNKSQGKKILEMR